MSFQTKFHISFGIELYFQLIKTYFYSISMKNYSREINETNKSGLNFTDVMVKDAIFRLQFCLS